MKHPSHLPGMVRQIQEGGAGLPKRTDTYGKMAAATLCGLWTERSTSTAEGKVHIPGDHVPPPPRKNHHRASQVFTVEVQASDKIQEEEVLEVDASRICAALQERLGDKGSADEEEGGRSVAGENNGNSQLDTFFRRSGGKRDKEVQIKISNILRESFVTVSTVSTRPWCKLQYSKTSLDMQEWCRAGLSSGTLVRNLLLPPLLAETLMATSRSKLKMKRATGTSEECFSDWSSS